MKLTFCCADTPPEPWLEGLRAALPEAELSVWAPGAPPADYAIVWAPPQALIDEQPGLQALFPARRSAHVRVLRVLLRDARGDEVAQLRLRLHHPERREMRHMLWGGCAGRE